MKLAKNLSLQKDPLRVKQMKNKMRAAKKNNVLVSYKQP